MNDLLTVKEVAEILRVTPMTVYRAVETGALEHVRFGRTIRISRDALDAYIQKPKPQTPVPAKAQKRAPVTRL